MQDPELSIDQAMNDYRRLGYSENWINQRLKTIEVRKELTDEWRDRGVEEGQHANTRLKYWLVAKSHILDVALSTEKLRLAVYPTLTEYYRKLYSN